MENKITDKKIKWAKSKLKDVKLTTINGKHFLVKIDTTTNVAKMLEVTNKAVYWFYANKQ